MRGPEIITVSTVGGIDGDEVFNDDDDDDDDDGDAFNISD